MKRLGMILFGLLIFAVVFTGCGNEQNQSVKELSSLAKRYSVPSVHIDGQAIKVYHGKPFGSEFIRNIDPISFPPRSKVRIDFENTPPYPERINVEESRDGQPMSEAISIGDDHTFVLPEEEGIYMYSVEVKWSNLGEKYDSHTFVVKVN